MYIDLSYFRFEFVTHWLTVETPISQVSIFHYVVVILNQTWLVQTHFSHSGMFNLFVQTGLCTHGRQSSNTELLYSVMIGIGLVEDIVLVCS